MPIPVISATHSGASRPLIPIHSGRLFRRIPATPSEQSDTGVRISFIERSSQALISFDLFPLGKYLGNMEIIDLYIVALG